MSDITEELAKLAELRDRGVLTPEEFAQQKASLLNPPAAGSSHTPTPSVAEPAYAAPVYPVTSASKTPMYVGGGLLMLVVLFAALWATGVLAKMGIGSTPFGGSSPTIASSSPFGATNAPAANPFGAPAAAPTTAPTDAAPYSSTPAVTTNPLIGEWEVDGAPTSSCPQRAAFTDTMLVMTGTDGSGTPQTKQSPITYTVQSADTVTIAAQGETGTAHISGNHMTLDECSYSRSGSN